MAELEQLLDQARLLGEAIVAHPKVKAYLEAQRGVRDDQEARRLLTEYQQQATKVQQLTSQGQSIEPELKQQLSACEQAMASHESLKNLMRAQADYIDLMNRINQAMEEPLARASTPDG